MDLLRTLAADNRLRTLVALILLDLIMGVAASLKTGQFRPDEIARFYRTTVLPTLLGWASLRLLLPLISSELLGNAGGWLSEPLVTVLWAAGSLSLLDSILRSIQTIRRNGSTQKRG